MYRPNRIGPFPITDRANRFSFSGSFDDIANPALTQVWPYLPKTTLEEPTNIQLVANAQAIASRNTVSFGVPIDMSCNTDYLLISICGGITCNYAAQRVNVFPFLAYPNSDTLVSDDATKQNQSNNFTVLPMESVAFDTNQTSASVNTSILVTAPSAGNIVGIGGWAITAIGAVTDLDLASSMSVHAYNQDLLTRDPNR